MAIEVKKEGVDYASAVWVYDDSAGAYVNNTTEARTPAGTVFSVLADAADYLYIGSETRFDLVSFSITTVGQIGSLTWEYYAGIDGWTSFVPGYAELNEDGDAFDFSFSGVEIWNRLAYWDQLAFSNTSPHTASVPDTNSRFWIRVSTASVTTAPTIKRIQLRPYSSYCTPTDVANLLQLPDFDDTTTPTRQQIEDYIHLAEARIDYESRNSWKLNVSVEESHEFNLNGFKLDKRSPSSILKLEVWNGGAWDTLSEGRQNDYFLAPTVGMVHFSRYFLLPARFTSYNAPLWRWGGGEFEQPLRVTYLYGESMLGDPRRGNMVFDAARKLAAIDIYTNLDFTSLTISGPDRVSLSDKIELWESQVDNLLERLKGWEVF